MLAFPGIFRGALDVRATAITEGMKVAAAEAIAGVVADELAEDSSCPRPSTRGSRRRWPRRSPRRPRRDGVARTDAEPARVTPNRAESRE